MLVQPVPGLVPAAHAAAAASLPSLGGDDFLVLPLSFSAPRPTASAPSPVRAARPARRAAGPVEAVRTALGVGVGSTLGLSLGVLLCSVLG